MPAVTNFQTGSPPLRQPATRGKAATRGRGTNPADLCVGGEEQARNFHLAERIIALHADVRAMVVRWPDRDTLANDGFAML